MSTTDEQRPCAECGMVCEPREFHPYAACLMFRGCHDGDKVRANLAALAQQAPTPAVPLTPLLSMHDATLICNIHHVSIHVVRAIEIKLGRDPTRMSEPAAPTSSMDYGGGPFNSLGEEGPEPAAPVDARDALVKDALRDAAEGFREHVCFVRGSLLDITVSKWERLAASPTAATREAEPATPVDARDALTEQQKFCLWFGSALDPCDWDEVRNCFVDPSVHRAWQGWLARQAASEDWLGGQEFHELCMDYRAALTPGAVPAFALLQQAIRKNVTS